MDAQGFVAARVLTVLLATATTLGTLAIGVIASPPAVAVTCAEGGGCVVGDRGPGGGLVFLIQDGTVYEMSKWARISRYYGDAGDATAWCPSTNNGATSNENIDTGTAVGTGAANTTAMLEACAAGPAQLISGLSSGGKVDWYLPSKDELSALVDFLLDRGEPNGSSSADDGLMDNHYWSSSQGSTATQAWRNKQAVSGEGQQAKSGRLKARGVRSFPDPRAAQVVTWAPETSLSLASSSASLSSATTSGDGAVTYSVANAGTSGCAFADSSNSVLTYSAVGSCAVTATAAASSSYLEGTASATITISLATPTITWLPTTAFSLPGRTVALATATTSSDGAITYAVTSGDNCTVDPSTGALTYSATGQCVVSATTAETATYASASTSAAITIAAAAPAPGGSGGASGGGASASDSGGSASGGGEANNPSPNAADPVATPGASASPATTLEDPGSVGANQIAAFDPQQMAAIPAGQFKELSPETFKVMTSEQVAQLPIASVAAIRPARIAALVAEAVSGLSGEQLGALRDQSVRAMSTEQIAAITPTALSAVPASFLSQLKPARVAALAPEAIGQLGPEQVSAIRPAALGKMPANAFAEMAPEAVAALRPVQVQRLLPKQIAAIAPEVISEVPAGFLTSLKPAAVAALTPASVAALSPEQAAAIRPAGLAKMSIASLRRMDPEAVAALSIQQLRRLTPAQVARLTSAQLIGLSRKQLKAVGLS